MSSSRISHTLAAPALDRQLCRESTFRAVFLGARASWPHGQPRAFGPLRARCPRSQDKPLRDAGPLSCCGVAGWAMRVLNGPDGPKSARATRFCRTRGWPAPIHPVSLKDRPHPLEHSRAKSAKSSTVKRSGPGPGHIPGPPEARFRLQPLRARDCADATSPSEGSARLNPRTLSRQTGTKLRVWRSAVPRKLSAAQAPGGSPWE